MHRRLFSVPTGALSLWPCLVAGGHSRMPVHRLANCVTRRWVNVLIGGLRLECAMPQGVIHGR